jgi:hypothetical protein
MLRLSPPGVQVQPILEAGPVCNIDGFLDALAQLETSNDFLVQHGSLSAVQMAIAHSQVGVSWGVCVFCLGGRRGKRSDFKLKPEP